MIFITFYCMHAGLSGSQQGCQYTSEARLQYCNLNTGCFGKSGFSSQAADDTVLPGVGLTPRQCRNWHIQCASYPARMDTCDTMPDQTPWTSFCPSAGQISFPRRGGCAAPAGAKAWWHTAASDNFFVFHSCDGAGLMQDCLGYAKYAEFYGETFVPFICTVSEW
jgi:hypothetical protein